MSEKRTVKWSESGKHVAVDTVNVTVVEGPDAGAVVSEHADQLSVGTAQGNGLVLSDPTVSRYHVELERTVDGIRVRDHASTNGTFAGPIRVQDAVVPDGTILKVGRTTLRLGAGVAVDVELHAEEELAGLHGRSESMRRLMVQIGKVARTEAAALIVGESGTGKELIARAIHDLGPRAAKPFITVDCGAMAPNLVASELFGHERGAFTSADRQHIGAFERANGGTIFLDEVGELPAELQPNLLGALERKRFRRVGGRKDIEVDVRIVAATNRDLRAEVNAGQFRLDLYYRLAVVMLRVPPLRQRIEDLPLLIGHFLRESGHDAPVEEIFDEPTMTQLRAHHWPGNVRELRNLVEATLAMGEAYMPHDLGAGGMDPEDSAEHAMMINVAPVLPLAYKDARGAVLHEFEARYLKHWLEQSGGNVAKAAREARMDRSHLFHLLRRHELR